MQMQKVIAPFFLLTLTLAACSATPPTSPVVPTSTTSQLTETPTPTQTQAFTQVIIDGSSADWADYPITGSDPNGDQVAGSPDLAEVRAFSNDLYFYLLIELNEEGVTDHYDILLDIDGGDWEYQLSVWPERDEAVFAAFPPVNMGSVLGVTIAQDEVIEVKMPLSLIDGKPVLNLLLQTWLGNEVGDKASDLRGSLVDEIEAASDNSQISNDQNIPNFIKEIVFLEPGISVESIYYSSIRPQSARVGPDDQVFILGNGQTIYTFDQSGFPIEYFNLGAPNDRIEQFAIDAKGVLWIRTHGNNLYQINDQKQPVLFANSIGPEFAFDSQGNIYAVNVTIMQKITPAGQVSVVAEGFGFASRIAITKDDRILVVDRGGGTSKLLEVFADGTWETVIDDLPGVDWGIGISSENTIYLFDWSGFFRLDLNQKTKTPVDFYTNIGESGVFDSQGNLYIYHANNPFYRLDLASKAIDVIFHPKGNSPAMAVDPMGRIFVAYGENIPGGETTLYEVGPGNKLTEITIIPYRTSGSMSVTSDGVVLISAIGPSDQTNPNALDYFSRAVYQFNPVEGSINLLLECDCNDTNQNPVTGEYWWIQYNGVGTQDSAGQQRLIPFPDTRAQFGRLAFSQDGVLYALFVFGPTFSESNSVLYRLNTDETWEELHAANETFLDLTVDDAGDVYITGGISDASVFVANRSGVLYMLWKWDEETGLVPLAYDTGGDQFAIQFDSATNSIYYMHIEGLARFIFGKE